MMNEKVTGVQKQSLLKEVSEKTLDENFLKVTQSLPFLEIRLLDLKEPKVKIGQKIYVEIKGLPLPKLDYLSGETRKGQFIKELPILAEFDTVTGKERVKCDFEKVVLSFTVPNGAVDSLVNFLIPVREENVRSCSLDESAEMISRETGILYMKDYRDVYLPYRGFFLTVKCDACKTSPICPFGVIKFDSDDNCYVDKSICKGQTRVISGTEYMPDGRLVNSVQSENPCFMCFNGTESLSSRCLHRKVSKVMDSSTCACGSCAPLMQVVPGVCLREHCDYEAITGGNPHSTRCGNQLSMDNLGGIYSVDYDKCVGCYECYNKIICERVVMKAHIKKRAKANFNILNVKLVKPAKPYIVELKPLFPDNKVFFRIWGRGRNGLIDRTVDISLAYPREVRTTSSLLSKDMEIIDRVFITASVEPVFSAGSPIGAGRPIVETKTIDLKNMTRPPYLQSANLSLKFFGVLKLEYSLSGIGFI